MDFAGATLILSDGTEASIAGELFMVGYGPARAWAGVITTDMDLADNVHSPATLRLATGDHTVELERTLSRDGGYFRYSIAGSGPSPFGRAVF